MINLKVYLSIKSKLSKKKNWNFLISYLQTTLLTAVELDFARCLFDSGNHRAALLLCKRLGDSGNELRREFEILAEETM